MSNPEKANLIRHMRSVMNCAYRKKQWPIWSGRCRSLKTGGENVICARGQIEHRNHLFPVGLVVEGLAQQGRKRVVGSPEKAADVVKSGFFETIMFPLNFITHEAADEN